jgi:branched-chain amino acid transport system substrate-binding protein
MGYDAVMVFIDSMKRAGSTDPAKFLPEVGKTNYQGVIGPIAFDEKGDLRNGPITIYVVKGGKWEPLETVTPGGGTSVARASGSGAAAASSSGAAAASGPGATATAPAPDAAKK